MAALSFIGIVDFSPEANLLLFEARWTYATQSVRELLGYYPYEIIGRPSLEMVHPREMAKVRRLHYETIKQDKAACIVYLRLKHKTKGYVLCTVTRTIVHNVTVGSVSFAKTGSKAYHIASTANENTVVCPPSPELAELERMGGRVGHWSGPSPMPPDYIPLKMRRVPRDPGDDSDSTDEENFSYETLPSQSFRTALILERFSDRCHILYSSNSLLISANDDGRPFFDFVAPEHEQRIESWIELIKGWGVNDQGQPSNGGFVETDFTLLPEGRDSTRPSGNSTETQSPPQQRRGSLSSTSSTETPIPSRQRHGAFSSTRSTETLTPSRQRHGSSSSSSTRSGTLRSLPGAGTTPRSRHQPYPTREAPSFKVQAILSPHSDGLLVILRREVESPSPQR